MPRVIRRLVPALLLLALGLAACGGSDPAVLRLATTTSTYDSGLLNAIVPEFEAAYGVSVEIVAVGTGQALELGRAGDTDVVLVHARAREDAFVAEGHGTARYDVMFNDFVIVGPDADPAGIRGVVSAADALAAIATTGSTFASRGDDSGTHAKEVDLWAAAGIDPSGEWYKSLGQGMGSTLQFAAETGAYTLTDRGTYLSQLDNLDGLVVVFGGAVIEENPDPALFNPYGIIPVSSDKEGIASELAMDFVEWITSVEVQALIGTFPSATGDPLFYPDSEEWRTSR